LDLALARGDLATVVQIAPNFDPIGSVRDNFLGATARFAQGDVQAARELLADGPSVLRKRIEQEPSNATLWSALGIVQALLGDREDALRCAGKAVELVPESMDSWTGLSYAANRAFVFAWTGDKDSSFAEYARLLRLPSFSGAGGGATGTDGTLNVHMMRHHPYFFPLQGDLRFEALLNDPKNNAPLF
jgi:tetratricopeptide (TPR) repeat protein